MAKYLRNNIRAIINQKGITVTEAARRCELNRSMLSDLISGRFPNPRIDTVIKISEGLKETIDDLIYRDFELYPTESEE